MILSFHMVLSSCKNCNNEFKPRSDAKGLFCSRKCNLQYSNKKRICKVVTWCMECNKKIIAAPSSKRLFCSQPCYFKSPFGKWKKGVKFNNFKTGENHHNWKGDKVGYKALHYWIKYNYGKANHCENNKCKGESTFFDWANISGKYKRDRNDFVMLCRKCHHKMDSIQEKVWAIRRQKYG